MTGFRYVAAAGLLALAAPAAAQATGPACGATITSDTRLRGDLVDCPADGLVIGADNVTLDLGRRTVDGTGAGVGIRLAGHRGVKIKGGTVREFGVGLALDGADGNRVSGVTVTGIAGRGIDLVNGSDGNDFTAVSSTGNRTGFAVTASTGNRLRLSNLSDNAVTGVLVFGSAKTKVQGNRVVNNAGNGIAFVEGSTGNEASANVVQGSVTSLWIDTSDRNLLTLNKVSGGGDGVLVAGAGNVVAGNVIDRSVGGCEGCFGYGIGVTAGTGNVVKANLVTRSAGPFEIFAEPGTVVGGGENRAARCANVSCRSGKPRPQGAERTPRPDGHRNGAGPRGHR
ncbi:right-handed parallel beta-helix repeat-containing protein [Solirubrobacter phytolaccae]|uniref:Right-handed parallel beta-helix repeat-containing protein n=1 Tax=Solirubrobacter phytolaccae TaxID=1404360 RepID=A0A9X3N739_9ACTN|nr:NosD domain-containing protein [Solirubrobacter phytolaccae]MDA0180706.1 right-handed parallel beta-helix repeat-containing protein [Solirubrobacter phytolaccae]